MLIKNLFWKIISVAVILLWITTLCVWYIIKTTPTPSPRYIKSGTLVIDTEENKIYNPSKKSWETWKPDIKKTKEAVISFTDALYDFGFTQNQIQVILTIAKEIQVKIEYDDKGEWGKMQEEVSRDYWNNEIK